MSLTELELNQQLIEALAERDRLRAEHCKTISARNEAEMERDQLQAKLAAALARIARIEKAGFNIATKCLMLEAKLAEAQTPCDGSFERQGKESHKAAIAALWETHPEIAYESPAQVIGWLQAQLAEAQKDSARLDWGDLNGLTDVFEFWTARLSTTVRQAFDAAMEKKP